MEPRRLSEISKHPARNLRSRQTRYDISSLNEPWHQTLDEYLADTPLSEVILRLTYDCAFGGAIYAVLLEKGRRDPVASDVAGFIAEEPRS